MDTTVASAGRLLRFRFFRTVTFASMSIDSKDRVKESGPGCFRGLRLTCKGEVETSKSLVSCLDFEDLVGVFKRDLFRAANTSKDGSGRSEITRKGDDDSPITSETLLARGLES